MSISQVEVATEGLRNTILKSCQKVNVQIYNRTYRKFRTKFSADEKLIQQIGSI